MAIYQFQRNLLTLAKIPYFLRKKLAYIVSKTVENGNFRLYKAIFEG